jgi:hypothetical protein
MCAARSNRTTLNWKKLPHAEHTLAVQTIFAAHDETEQPRITRMKPLKSLSLFLFVVLLTPMGFSCAQTKPASSSASAIPFPVSTHPRIWITQDDLPRLRSWAVSSNPIYQQGILPVLNQAVSTYNTQFFPNGSANPNYPDPGDTQGYVGSLTEQNGIILAFNSLIDPNPAARIRYAQYARNLLMHAMSQANLGHAAGAPFRDPAFAIYNRANASGEQWPLIVDWIYSTTDANGNPILSADDKRIVRNVFLRWADDCIHASTTGGDHPEPVGVMNSAKLLPNNQPYRMAANNYYLAHGRLLTMMALSIDPVDDPPVNSSVSPTQLGNTLRSYIPDATGAWLYQEFAMFGDPPVVTTAYHLPNNVAGFGLASGGLPPEGMLYGHSFAYLLGQLLALHTAGFDGEVYSGPQIQLIRAPLWDRYVSGFLSSLTPEAKTFASESSMGKVFQYTSYGDLLRLWVTPDFMQSFALLAVLDEHTGSSNHLAAARWISVNATQGGSSALLSRITKPWSFTESILYFMLLDPKAPTAADPRPTFPKMFFDAPAARIIAHSDWTPNAIIFDYRASWISINHQNGDGGQFELFRKGEWLTKEMSNYDNNAVGMTTMYHNTLSLQNACSCPGGSPANLQWYESGMWKNGSQWLEGVNAGDPTTITSTGPDYVFASSDLTNLYNRPSRYSPGDSAVSITQATRAIIWLENDYIVVYDRATSRTGGLFKRFNLNFVTKPVMNNGVATETLPGGQKLYVQTLLPHNPLQNVMDAAGNLSPIAELEPTRYILTVEDASKPADIRFLHVLQAADSGTAMVQSTPLHSAGGVAFDGAVVGGEAVFFPVTIIQSFTPTSFSIPAGVHTVLVTGLKENSHFGVTTHPAEGGTSITITPEQSGASTDAAGVLRVTF